MIDRKRFTAPLLAALLLATAGLSSARDRPVQLEVDAREAPRKIFHAKMTIPVKAGRLTLLYPKWLPGEHGPTGPIADLAGLTFTAGGRPLRTFSTAVERVWAHRETPANEANVESGRGEKSSLNPASGRCYARQPLGSSRRSGQQAWSGAWRN